MKLAVSRIDKEILKLQKKHDILMKKYYKTISLNDRFGNSAIYQEADKISDNQQILIKAKDLLNKYINL